MSKEMLQVTDKFQKQNSKHPKTKKHIRKGGPYSKSEMEKRRDEVYRLHFEYRYSARKIAELMKVNRNTINGDIDYWYSEIGKNVNIFNPEVAVLNWLEQMEIQLTRLREQLDKVKNNSERMAIERLIYDINSRVLQTYLKLSNSSIRAHKFATERLNNYMEKCKDPGRFISVFDTYSVSKKSRERINKIIKEDRPRVI